MVPTHVGMTPERTSPCERKNYGPHACGDDPRSHLFGGAGRCMVPTHVGMPPPQCWKRWISSIWPPRMWGYPGGTPTPQMVNAWICNVPHACGDASGMLQDVPMRPSKATCSTRAWGNFCCGIQGRPPCSSVPFVQGLPEMWNMGVYVTPATGYLSGPARSITRRPWANRLPAGRTVRWGRHRP